MRRGKVGDIREGIDKKWKSGEMRQGKVGVLRGNKGRGSEGSKERRVVGIREGKEGKVRGRKIRRNEGRKSR